ncbi:MAG: glycosyltransferase, partial [bacterium]
MRVLVYFQHKPYPATTGAHIRCQAVLRALRELRHEVTLFSSNLLTDTSWTAESVAEVEETFGIRVVIHRGTPDDTLYCAAIRWDDLPRKQWGDFAPPAMKAAFVELARDWHPDAVIINYTFFGNLICDPVFSRCLKIMESLDMFSLNGQMQRAFLHLLPGRPIHADRVCSQLLDQTFLSDLDLSVWPEEYAVCDQFDVTTAVSRNETEGIAAHTSNTQAVWAPITAESRELSNTYGGNPVYMAAINALNVQGYLYFARKVLPLIQSRKADFMLDAVGACSTIMDEVAGIRNLGYVPSLDALYRDAAFAICPLIGATGQQIKVIEAMAYGVPAVVLRNVAASSPVIHGVNGFIADTPEEMAGYCLRLRADQQLCRSFGNAARGIVARDWSQQRLVNTFREILSRKPGAASCRRKPPARTRQASQTTEIDFSLVVDARARSEELQACLASVSNQSGVMQETIVVSTIPVAGYHHATSIAEALAAANGRWIGLLHASDLLHTNALATARRALRNSRCRGWITSRLAMVDAQ